MTNCYGVSMGGTHSLIIIDGSVYSWGNNTRGQLGDGTTNDSTTPNKIKNLKNVVAVALGLYHSMALCQDGDVYVWGDNDDGQLGDGTTVNSKIPKKLNTLGNIIMIACSNCLSMALTIYGEVYTWGNNFSGQLGNLTNMINILTTPQKVANLSNIVAITCGDHHSIALTKEGEVYSWGGNGCGQLGNGSTTSSIIPQKITTITNVTAITCSRNHVLAITYDSHLYSWGFNRYGQLGNGTTDNNPTPLKIDNLTDIVAIACGFNHSMALTKDGNVYSWGRNDDGQLGIGSNTKSIIPQKINTLDNVCAIACLGCHSMAITKDGLLYVWGYNYSGQLGNGSFIPSNNPQQVSLPPGTLQWLTPNCSPNSPSYLPLYSLLSHMESISNSLRLPLTVGCNNHQFHTLHVNQTQFYLHKAMLAVRAPGLLNLKELDIDPIHFQDIIHFIYTNAPLNFKNMEPTQITRLIHLCKGVNLIDLIPSCQEALIASLTKDNVLATASQCYSLNLIDELDCISWFIGKTKLSLQSEDILNLKTNSSILTKLMVQEVNSTLLPPTFFSQVKPLEDVMEVLFTTKIHSDFTINFKNTFIEVHKFVLAPRWPYFTNIMLKDQSTTLHYSPMPLDIFGKLIQYFYVGTKCLTLRDCGWILYLSEYYLLHNEKSLLNYCEQMVNFEIDLNWSLALQLAMEINNKEIEKKAISMIPSLIDHQQIVSICLGFVIEQQRKSKNNKLPSKNNK